MGGFFDFSRCGVGKVVGSSIYGDLGSGSSAMDMLRGWKSSTTADPARYQGVGAATWQDQYKPGIAKSFPFGSGGALSGQIAASAQTAFLANGITASLPASLVGRVTGGVSSAFMSSNLLGARDSSARLVHQLAGIDLVANNSAMDMLRGWKSSTTADPARYQGVGAATWQDQYKPGIAKSFPFGSGGALSGQIAASAQTAFLANGITASLPASLVDRVTGKLSSSIFGGHRVLSLFDRMDQVERELKESDPACARLSVLLAKVGVGRALVMMERMAMEGTAPLLEVLEKILLTPKALDIFEEVIRAAGLPALVEGDLVHALEHLREGSTDHALPPLLNGLEGALRDAVRKRGDSKKRSNARSLAAALKMEKDHELLVGTIYDHANDGRHGAELDRREACVLVLVGLILWMTECRGEPGVEWLSREVDRHLSTPASVAA